MMTIKEFHNALRILLSIDSDELSKAGIDLGVGERGYRQFIEDPFRWFIRANDDNSKKLFWLIQSRDSERKSHD